MTSLADTPPPPPCDTSLVTDGEADFHYRRALGTVEENGASLAQHKLKEAENAFKRLKFSFIELNTKKNFLSSIPSASPAFATPSQDDVTEHEIAVFKRKEDLKRLKLLAKSRETTLASHIAHLAALTSRIASKTHHLAHATSTLSLH
eukprot:CAMPEP_0174898820 /NCGR_PEP_ID=MMETSP0167-20121228/23882_1 /TAXON_ID=38298 /ORGANISM="Rhodella maculata, Strain CCMP736" /LENGTH=147 /DNA_ID=CAMNT_0016139579 /DNA_START=28 /DNA_END=468 /DNA_ORIENTATION=+